MRRSLSLLLSGLLGLLLAQTAAALSLGDIQVDSRLGEPLQARIALRGAGDLTEEQLLVSLADEQHYRQMGLEREYSHTRLRFDISLNGKTGTGEIRVRSQEPMREPQIGFVLQARWPKGHTLRSYNILLDLPQLAR